MPIRYYLIESAIKKIVLKERKKRKIMENNERFVSLERAISIINNLDMSEVVEKTLDEYSGSSFYESICFLDLQTGKVFYRQMGKNESFQDSYRFFRIYDIDDQTISYIPDDDIAGDDDIPEGGVEDFPDYDDRLLDVLIWYAENNEYEIKKQCINRLRDEYIRMQGY